MNASLESHMNPSGVTSQLAPLSVHFQQVRCRGRSPDSGRRGSRIIPHRKGVLPGRSGEPDPDASGGHAVQAQSICPVALRQDYAISSHERTRCVPHFAEGPGSCRHERARFAPESHPSLRKDRQGRNRHVPCFVSRGVGYRVQIGHVTTRLWCTRP